MHTAIIPMFLTLAGPPQTQRVIAAACECLPEIVDEFEGYHCPGFG